MTTGPNLGLITNHNGLLSITKCTSDICCIGDIIGRTQQGGINKRTPNVCHKKYMQSGIDGEKSIGGHFWYPIILPVILLTFIHLSHVVFFIRQLLAPECHSIPQLYVILHLTVRPDPIIDGRLWICTFTCRNYKNRMMITCNLIAVLIPWHRSITLLFKNIANICIFAKWNQKKNYRKSPIFLEFTLIETQCDMRSNAESIHRTISEIRILVWAPALVLATIIYFLLTESSSLLRIYSPAVMGMNFESSPSIMKRGCG